MIFMSRYLSARVARDKKANEETAAEYEADLDRRHGTIESIEIGMAIMLLPWLWFAIFIHNYIAAMFICTTASTLFTARMWRKTTGRYAKQLKSLMESWQNYSKALKLQELAAAKTDSDRKH